MIAAIDPGTGKFGWVLCENTGALLLSGVSPIDDLGEWASIVGKGDLKALEPRAAEKSGKEHGGDPPDLVLVGTGTGSGPVIELLRASGLPVKIVPEQYSSIRGRELFWKIHPPGGLWKLFPKTLLVPNRSVDDLAAWSLLLDFVGCEPGEYVTSREQGGVENAERRSS